MAPKAQTLSDVPQTHTEASKKGQAPRLHATTPVVASGGALGVPLGLSLSDSAPFVLIEDAIMVEFEAPLDLYHYQPQLEQEEIVTLVSYISTRMKASHSIQLRDKNDIKRTVFQGETFLDLSLGKPLQSSQKQTLSILHRGPLRFIKKFGSE